MVKLVQRVLKGKLANKGLRASKDRKDSRVRLDNRAHWEAKEQRDSRGLKEE
jgi:hypothetical protein